MCKIGENCNPGLIVVDNNDYVDLYDEAYTSSASDQYKNIAVWDWIAENGDDALGLVNGVLCTIKPDRPGCPGSASPGGGAYFRQNNTALYILIAVVIVLAVVIIFKK